MHSIHRLFSQKNLLSKLFLLIVLFFSGCSTTTDDVIDLVSDGIGMYTANDTEYQFFISDNADSYKDSDGNVLVYASRGYDYIIYKGYNENNDLITVYLTELSGTKGVYTKYKGNEMIQLSGFSWIINTPFHKMKGQQIYLYIEKNGTIESFEVEISNDGFTVADKYLESLYDESKSESEETRALTRIGDDWVEYQGWYNDTWVTIAFIDITDDGGTYQLYLFDELELKIAFIWQEES